LTACFIHRETLVIKVIKVIQVIKVCQDYLDNLDETEVPDHRETEDHRYTICHLLTSARYYYELMFEINVHSFVHLLVMLSPVFGKVLIIEMHTICLSVCLSVCPLAYLENHTAELHEIFVHVACGRGSILLWRRCDTLCTSFFCGRGYIMAQQVYF